MKRLILYIFIPVLSILLMSHNTSALEINQVVEFKQTWTNARMACAARYGNNITVNGNTCTFGLNQYSNVQGRGLSYIYTSDVNLVQGDYYELFLDVSVSDLAEVAIPVMWNLNTTSNFTIVGFEQVSNNNNLGTQADNEAYVSSYKIILRSSVNNSSYPIELGYSDHSKNFLYIAGATEFSTNYIVDVRITRINRYSPKSNDEQSIVDAINEQTEQEQDAASDIQNQSTSDIGNSTNAETQSLLSAFGSFVSAIASISPSNCMVDFDLGHIDFGEQNLCSVAVPVVFTSITSIIVIMFTIPFVYHLVNRILGLIREMQT